MRSEIESLLFIKGLAARGGGKSLQGETRGRAREKKFNRGGQVPALTPSVAFIALTVLFSLSWEKKNPKHFPEHKVQTVFDFHFQQKVCAGKIYKTIHIAERTKLSESRGKGKE